MQIAYHDTTRTNDEAIAATELRLRKINDQKIIFPRTKTKIPHNKFIVRLKNGTEPIEVWTGSTNFTPSGFLGQTNVGHRVADAETARQYLEYWKLLKTIPTSSRGGLRVTKLTPNPPELIEREVDRAAVLAARRRPTMLGWYGRPHAWTRRIASCSPPPSASARSWSSRSRRSATCCASC